MSGYQLTYCSSHFILLFYLNCKSPIDLDKFISPFILLFSIYPFAFIILDFYEGFYGLWSADNWSALFPLYNTALESPTLPIYIIYLVINATHAVHPAIRAMS